MLDQDLSIQWECIPGIAGSNHLYHKLVARYSILLVQAHPGNQWPFQVPGLEVPFHMKLYLEDISPENQPLHRPKKKLIYIVGTSNLGS